jgi:hypothetical protein
MSLSVVRQLRNDYTGGVSYGVQSLSAAAGGSIVNNGFMGSEAVVFLSANDSITMEAPGCVAAPLVTMVAKNAISLGMSGQGSQPVPVRLYAGNQLSITTDHLSIGDIALVTTPEHGMVFCRKLTLSTSQEHDPAYFEIVQSWLMSTNNRDVEIERVRRT